jgi:murein DD-endopeptidase MepM/ murein hydrolase activator NlpD
MKAVYLALVWAVLILSNVATANTKLFQVPYDTSLGMYERTGYHTELYGQPYNGYHMGEDWNRVPNTSKNEKGDIDNGDRLNAIADGTVTYVNDDVPGKGKVVVVRYTLPTGDAIKSAYYHCKTITVKSGDKVTRGQKIAELGGTWGYTPHLHWQIETKTDLSIYTNPYHGKQQPGGPARDPMTPANALR